MLVCWKQEKWASVEIWVTLTSAKLQWLDDSVRGSPKHQVLWGVPYQTRSKKGQPVNQWPGHEHPSFTEVNASSMLKRFMLARIKRCQDTQKIKRFAVYVAASLQTCQNAHADPSPLLEAPTVGMWASELDQDVGLVWFVIFPFFFFFHVNNRVLGNLEAWHSCRCYFHTHHLPKHCYRPSTLLHGNCIP